MADQDQVVEIPLLLENVLRFSINQARDRMLEGEVIEPFTALAQYARRMLRGSA